MSRISIIGYSDNDPSLLSVHASFNKDINTAGLSGENVTVWVRDKNSQALSLKDGKVIVNDVELSVFKSLIGKLPFYKASGSVMPINENQSYNLEIILGNSQKYNSQLTIPNSSLKTFNCPSTHNASEPLIISWNKLSLEFINVLSWCKTAKGDSITKSLNGSMELDASISEYEFPISFFQEGNLNIIKVEIMLNSLINGKMCSDFRSNSSINANFSIKKNVIIQ